MAGYSNQKVFILYEDEHLLVVKKPFGMESQRGKSFAMGNIWKLISLVIVC